MTNYNTDKSKQVTVFRNVQYALAIVHEIPVHQTVKGGQAFDSL